MLNSLSLMRTLGRSISRAKFLLFIGALLTAMLSIPQRGLCEGTYVAGAVSGTWNLDGSPYLVVGDIWVPENSTLTIDPGVTVQFMGLYSFDAYGRLNAGDIDEPRVWIGSDRFTEWNGISFDTRNGLSSLIGCDIVNAWVGVKCEDSYLSIRECRIEAGGTGVSCINSSIEIRDNLLIKAGHENSIATVYGIRLEDGSNAVVINNERIETITSASGIAFGIWVTFSSPVIRQNGIESTSLTEAYGIYIVQVAKMFITRNIIRVNSPYQMYNLWTREATGIIYRNNTTVLSGLAERAVGIRLEAGSHVSVINNIVVGNVHSIGISAHEDALINEDGGYNDFWLHAQNYDCLWRGAGDISEDPLFAGDDGEEETEFYSLTWADTLDEETRSPCIDAGIPTILDPDNTRSDMGRYYYHQYPVSITEMPARTPEKYSIISAHPNPFNASTVLSAKLPQSWVGDVSAYDLTGRPVAWIARDWKAGQGAINWTPSNLPAGEYIIMMHGGKRTLSVKVVYLP